MMPRRFLALLVCACLVCSLGCVGASADDISYVDSGLGWYCKSQFFVSSSGEFASVSGRYGDYTYSKKNSGPALVFIMIDNSGSYSSSHVYCLSTNPDFCYQKGNTYTGPQSLLGFSWYYTEAGNTYLDSSTLSPTTFNVPYQHFSYQIDLISYLLDCAGVTTDSSVVVPPAPSTLFVTGTYNNKPVRIIGGSGDVSSLPFPPQTLGASYNLFDSAYTPVWDSSDFVQSGIFPYQVLPSGYNAEYVCFESMIFSGQDYKSIHITGGFQFYMQSDYTLANGDTGSKYLYPDNSYLYVNGERVYCDVTNLGQGVFNYDGWVNIPEDGNIVSVGVWSSFSQTMAEVGVTDFTVGFYGSNSLTVVGTPVVAPDPDAPSASLDDVYSESESINSGIASVDQKAGGILGLLMDMVGNFGQMVFNLFAPSEDDLIVLKDEYETVLSEKLGFAGQSVNLITNFVTDVSEGLENAEEYTFRFPGISFPMNGQTYQIVAAQDVSLQNDFLTVVRPVLSTIVEIVCTLAFLNVAESAFIAIWSGSSYFDWLHGRKQE